MSRKEKAYTIILSAATFIVLEIAALAMLNHSSTLQNIWLNRISHRISGAVWGGGEKVRSHFHTEECNAMLSEENVKLRNELQKYRSEEAARLEKDALVEGGEAKSPYRFISASIVKMSRNTSHNHIIINKGSEDGVVPQSGIISDRGVVGVVSAVDRHYSYGLTLLNTNVSVSARIGNSDIVAPLRWNGLGSDRAVIEDIPPHCKITTGDTVKTSGYSSIFPPDIPIGLTTDRTRLVDGSTISAEVELFQDFASLRYVTVTENTDRDEILELEKKGKEAAK